MSEIVPSEKPCIASCAMLCAGGSADGFSDCVRGSSSHRLLLIASDDD